MEDVKTYSLLELNDQLLTLTTELKTALREDRDYREVQIISQKIHLVQQTITSMMHMQSI